MNETSIVNYKSTTSCMHKTSVGTNFFFILQNELEAQQLANIFSALYGEEPIPPIKVDSSPPAARIGKKQNYHL